MLVSESTIPYELEDVYILECGTFYFFSSFIISEINEGITFDWELASQVIDIAIGHYGEKPRIGYISNRVYSYALKPQDWLKFFKARHTLTSFAIVDTKGQTNALIEKMFFKSKIKKFTNLMDATSWVHEHTVTNKNQHLTG